MAKVSYAKLGLKMNNDVEIIEFNGQKIEVKKYLPIQEKMKMVVNIISNTADENRFFNPMKLDVFFAIEVIENYTNLSITEKQKEDVAKFYDLIITSDLYNSVISVINKSEIDYIKTSLKDFISSIYSYKNSIMGILDDIVENYSDFVADGEAIQKALGDPENLSLLKTILTKLG